MKLRAVIAHCWNGSPEAGWYPGAQAALAELGIPTTVPRLPEPAHPVLEDWLDALTTAIGTPDPGLMLIGHSLGAVALLHWLARSSASTRIAGLLLVAPPVHATGVPEVDRFLTPTPDLVLAGTRAASVDVLVSTLDPWLKPNPLHLARRLWEDLDATITIVADRGHFAPSSGHTPLPELREWAANFIHAEVPDTQGA